MFSLISELYEIFVTCSFYICVKRMATFSFLKFPFHRRLEELAEGITCSEIWLLWKTPKVIKLTRLGAEWGGEVAKSWRVALWSTKMGVLQGRCPEQNGNSKGWTALESQGKAAQSKLSWDSRIIYKGKRFCFWLVFMFSAWYETQEIWLQ